MNIYVSSPIDIIHSCFFSALFQMPKTFKIASQEKCSTNWTVPFKYNILKTNKVIYQFNIV